MESLKFTFGNKTLYINRDDWQAQKDFIEEKERAFIRNVRRWNIKT